MVKSQIKGDLLPTNPGEGKLTVSQKDKKYDCEKGR